jgi:hypothetical protein
MHATLSFVHPRHPRLGACNGQQIAAAASDLCLGFAAYQGAWTVMTEDSAKLNIIKAIRIRSLKRKSYRTRRLGLDYIFLVSQFAKSSLSKHKWGAQEFVASVGFCARELSRDTRIARNQLPDHILRETREREEKKRQRGGGGGGSSTSDSRKNVLSESNLTELYWVPTIGA